MDRNNIFIIFDIPNYNTRVVVCGLNLRIRNAALQDQYRVYYVVHV